jgi:putative ubiquitin-RnfH superfamily antitoxin RatB of RatAB toxin-antitoxin module
MSGGTIAVTVAWATPDLQDIVPLTLPVGATLANAVARSGLLDRHGIDPGATRVGIHGRLARDDTVLADGDRVEIYRPLVADPKEARRLRARSKAGASSTRRRPA